MDKMETKSLVFSDDARKKLQSGVAKLAQAVKATLGPRGRNVLIQHKDKPPSSTRDGITVANNCLPLADPQENMGAQAVRQASNRTCDQAGDGTSTTVVIAQKLFDQGLMYVSAGHHAISLKRGMDKAVDQVIANLDAQSKQVKSNADIRNVATISANNDIEIGDMIANALDAVGNDGVVTLEDGKDITTKLKVQSGYEFDRGFLSAYFMTPSEVEQGRYRCLYENARVWLVNGKLSTTAQMQDMLPVLEQCMNSSQPVVLIAEDCTDVVLNTLALNCAQGRLQVVAIKAPGFGATRNEMREDLATITGATIRDPDHFESVVKDVSIEELGHIKRIEVYKDRTIIIGPDGRAEAIETQCNRVRAHMEQLEDAWDKEQQRKRLAKLTGGVAVISVGAPTDIGMKEKRDRIEDALGATRAAVEGGIVSGGGTALLRASKALEFFTTGNDEEDFGVKIVREAIREPIKAIVVNAGESPDVIMDKAMQGPDGFGYDARAKEFCNLFDRGVVDPTKVVKVALQNASDVAGLLLLTECTITIDNRDEVDAQHPSLRFHNQNR
jgi:chaperonin GroEL